MASDSIEMSEFFPVVRSKIYDAWLNGAAHSKMTGGAAQGEPRVGAKHSAWDGYIRGENMALIPDRRIVQSWSTTEFPEGANPSLVEVELTEENGGTRLTLRHTELPPGDAAKYRVGWIEHYFEPMKRYFEAAEPAAAPRRTPKPTRKKTRSKSKASARAKKSRAGGKPRAAKAPKNRNRGAQPKRRRGSVARRTTGASGPKRKSAKAKSRRTRG